MKELGCKILAAIFIVLIIASLTEMRRDIMIHTRGPHAVISAGNIGVFDTVLLEREKQIGLVEQVTNNLYHVVYSDGLHNAIHAIYTKNQIHKVLIIVPQSNEQTSR